MRVIKARNVEEAWAVFRMVMHDPVDELENGSIIKVSPRGMDTLEFAEPVTTVYSHPAECCLMDPVRDANPFFHLYEALWILCGYGDVARVKLYSSNIAQFSDDGTTFNGAYGARLRYASMRAMITREEVFMDQIGWAIDLLRKDPDTRRCVLQLWEPEDLTNQKSKDVPCNTALFLKLRGGVLNMTVLNRSNDAVWGCYGANAVQFGILLQYMAGQIGARVGTLRQVSDSLHVYTSGKPGEVWQRIREQTATLYQSYSPVFHGYHYIPLMPDEEPMVTSYRFDAEMRQLLAPPDGSINFGSPTKSPWLRQVFEPMMRAHYWYRKGDIGSAIVELEEQIKLVDTEAWLCAGLAWLQRRKEAREERSTR